MRILSSAIAAAVAVALIGSCSMQPSLPTDEGNTKAQGKIFAAPAGKTKVQDHYIVVFKDDVNPNDLEGEIARLRGKHDFTVELKYSSALVGFAGIIPPGQLAKLADDDRILRISEDFEVSLSGITKSSPGNEKTIAAETTDWGVTAVGGSATEPVGGWTNNVYVIDTGIDPNTGDLNINTALCKTFVTSGKITWNDLNGHGTHVSGTIGAKKGNGIGMAGVAPGAKLVAVRVLDNRGSGRMSWALAGVNYVASVGKPNDVVNMSLGGPAYLDLNLAIQNASDKQGIFFALAAGNSGADCSSTSPAMAQGIKVYTVSAHDAAKVWAYFSNYGLPVDVCAPGVKIVSLKPGGGTALMSGTSMAAPHVAGLLYAYGGIAQTSTPTYTIEYVTGEPNDGRPDILAFRP